MNHSNTSIRLCEEILNEKTCHDLCRKYKFIKRSSRKLEGYEFIKAMIIPSEGLSTDSLQGICKRMHDFNPQANLTAQALCKRINQVAAPVLMKAIFIEILSYMHSKEIERNPLLSKALGDFNRILVEDSTVCALNEKLQEHFKGANRGGTGAKSQIKIDFIYNLMTSTMVDSEIYQGNEPDQGIAGRILQHIQPRDLVLRDLGYAVLKSFQAITDKGAYFLSRLQPNVKVYCKRQMSPSC